jgi:hypothetical protein
MQEITRKWVEPAHDREPAESTAVFTDGVVSDEQKSGFDKTAVSGGSEPGFPYDTEPDLGLRNGLIGGLLIWILLLVAFYVI